MYLFKRIWSMALCNQFLARQRAEREGGKGTNQPVGGDGKRILGLNNDSSSHISVCKGTRGGRGCSVCVESNPWTFFPPLSLSPASFQAESPLECLERERRKTWRTRVKER